MGTFSPVKSFVDTAATNRVQLALDDLVNAGLVDVARSGHLAGCHFTRSSEAQMTMQDFVSTSTAPQQTIQQTEPVVSSTLELQNAAAGLVSSATIGDATINNKADSQIIYRGGDNFRFNS